MEKVFCKICGKEFIKNSINHIFCSERCMRKNMRNKDTYREKRRKYQNGERYLSWRREYERKRLHNEPEFRLRKNVAKAVRKYLIEKKNYQSITQHFPYSMQELKEHLESQFNGKFSWETYGKEWHIDHIIPQSLFFITNIESPQLKECWALSNLRPLEAKENMRKGARLLEEYANYKFDVREM